MHALKKTTPPPPVETPPPPAAMLLPSATSAQNNLGNCMTAVAVLLSLVGIPALMGVKENNIIFALHVTDTITALLNAGHFLASVYNKSAGEQRCFARNMTITHSLYVGWVLYLAMTRSVDSADLPLFVTGTVCVIILGLTKGCGTTMEMSTNSEKFMMSAATHMLWLLYMLSYSVAFQVSPLSARGS